MNTSIFHSAAVTLPSDTYMKTYMLDNSGDLEQFNRTLKVIGVMIQEGMFGGYMAYLDEGIFNRITTRKAGRRTVMTPQVILSVLQYRSEGLTIREIAQKTHISKSSVGTILKNHQFKAIVPEGQLSIDDI